MELTSALKGFDNRLKIHSKTHTKTYQSKTHPSSNLNNHLFELLNRSDHYSLASNIDRSDEPDEPKQSINNSTKINETKINETKINEIKINETKINNMAHKLKNIIENNEHTDPNSLLHSLNFIFKDNFLIISTNDISESLRHIDPQLDRVLHQSKVAVFDKTTYFPIFYLEKSIKDSDLSFTENENSYLKSYLYEKLPGFKNDEFDQSRVSIHKNHIGSYLILFCHDNKWFFLFSNNAYEFSNENHPVLYGHLKNHINGLDKNLCYHIVLVDSRLRKLITSLHDVNHIVLIKTTTKYTLEENFNNPYNFFTTDHRIYVSCMDELNVRLEELDIKNTRVLKLLNRGFIVKIKIDECDPLLISYDTYTYKRLMNMIPKGLKLHEVHLKLYQTDRLNHFLHFVNDSYTDIVKRINISMSTMSREILDIYHMTRKKKHSKFYKLLPQSYRHLLYQLHSDYIAQKNESDKANTQTRFDPDNKNHESRHQESRHQESRHQEPVRARLKIVNKNNPNFIPKDETMDMDDIDNKVSISVDNVYTKLKDIDIMLLVELYRDRDILIKNIENYETGTKHNDEPDAINGTGQDHHTDPGPGSLEPWSRTPGSLEPWSRTPGSLEPWSRTPGTLEPWSRTPGSLEPWSRTPVSGIRERQDQDIKNPIKVCTNTKIQTKLLSLNQTI
jgi:hypothetical protein